MKRHGFCHQGAQKVVENHSCKQTISTQDEHGSKGEGMPTSASGNQGKL